MSKWIVRISEAYERDQVLDFENAKQVVDFLNTQSGYARSSINIEPYAEKTYEPREFETAYAMGEVE